MNFLILWWRESLIALLAALLLATFSLWRHEVSSSLEFRLAVAAKGKEQNAKAEAINTKQKQVTKETELRYDQSLTAITSIYGAGRVQLSTSGRKLPRVSKAASKSNETAEVTGLDSGVSAPGKAQCDGLTSDAAADALQVLYLQDWLERQGR